MIFLSIIVLVGFLVPLFYYFFQLQQRYQYFSRCGIPTPPFRFFFGHLKTLWNVPSYHRQLESWTKQYGKIYGIYEGTSPMFVVSDPDFIQEVFVKQFSVFHSRKTSLLDNIFRSIVFDSGASWRRQRHVINPSFASAKLKLMSPLINGCISDLMKKFPDHVEGGEEFNIYLYYKRLSMDAICKYMCLCLFLPTLRIRIIDFILYIERVLKHVVTRNFDAEKEVEKFVEYKESHEFLVL